MRATPNLAVERYRVRDGRFATNRALGNNGMFVIPVGPFGVKLGAIVSDATLWAQAFAAMGREPPALKWEHVSVSGPGRCPTWEEMSAIKDLFWREDETVVQLHPPRADYVNDHPFVLHLWRPIGVAIPLPDKVLVGDGKGRVDAARVGHDGFGFTREDR